MPDFAKPIDEMTDDERDRFFRVEGDFEALMKAWQIMLDENRMADVADFARMRKSAIEAVLTDIGEAGREIDRRQRADGEGGMRGDDRRSLRGMIERSMTAES